MSFFSGMMGVLSGAGWYVLPFVAILSVVVFFHELGHYLVGRWCGVKIDTFSLGFGPELFARVDKRGTRWRVASCFDALADVHRPDSRAANIPL